MFHNLSDYDAYFIIKEIATAYDERAKVLPITKEKYIFYKKMFWTTKKKHWGRTEKNNKITFYRLI